MLTKAFLYTYFLISKLFCLLSSFGIVMWEIWWRKIPYHNHRFRFIHDLTSAVLEGLRPAPVGDDQSNYVKLMRACWSGNTTADPISVTLLSH